MEPCPASGSSTKQSTSSHLAGLPQITGIQTTTLNGRILVSWRAPLQPVDGYVIDYTHNGDQFTCVETKHTSVTLSGKSRGRDGRYIVKKNSRCG